MELFFRVIFVLNVIQWEIVDVYYEDFEKQVSLVWILFNFYF